MKTRTKRNDPNQMAFNFTPVRPGFPICETEQEIGATLAAFGINGKSKTPAFTLAGPRITPQVPALAGMTPLGITPTPEPETNATFESSPGSVHRVILHSEVREGHRLYRRIQFPGATYSDGKPRIQTVNGGVVTPDPF